jgi:hypothetical protein
MYRKWLGAGYGKKVMCMVCNRSGFLFTADGGLTHRHLPLEEAIEIRMANGHHKPETEEAIFARNIPIAEEIAARLIREERERKQESMTGFSLEDAVHWVHIDRKDEPDTKVHLMIGEEEQNINLTECRSDAGLNPKEASLNSVTAGDLCAECLAGFIRQCGYHVRYS